MDAAFVSQCNMREERGKEPDAAGELVVVSEPRMKPSPPVEDATVVLVLEPLKRHGWALEVLKEGLELLALARGDAAICMDCGTPSAPNF